MGHLFARQLLSAGERVLDVQPRLGARVRLLAAGDVNKNDQSGTGCLERRRDVLDRLLLGRAYALPSLAVSLGDLVGDSKHEAPVAKLAW